MKFADVSAGVSLFLDANTLIYHFTPEPDLGPLCRTLIDRIARQEIAGFTSAHVLSNIAHRLMTLEAMSLLGWPAAGIASRLKRHHAEVRNLHRYRLAIDEVAAMGIHVMAITQSMVVRAAALSQQHELLSGDALVVAAMQSARIVHVASHDSDFDRVPGIIRYAPV